MSTIGASNLNLLYGSDFFSNPWQRGTSFVSPATDDYLADRWQIRKVGVQQFTVTKDNSGPTTVQSQMTESKSMKFDVTTANAAPGVGDFTTIEQPIEGNVSHALYDKTIFVNFWVYSSLAGTYCISMQNDLRNRSYVIEYPVLAPNTWEFVEFEMPHDTTGTWETGTLTGLRFISTLNTGSTFHTTPDAWQAGEFYGTSNQVNLTALNTHEFRISNVRLTNVPTRGVFLPRSFHEDLLLCQRYFQKSYDASVAPGTVTLAGSNTGKTGGITQVRELQRVFTTPMRTVPAIVWYNPVTGAANNIYEFSGGTNHAVINQYAENENSTGWPETVAFLLEPEAQWAADAEL